MSQVHTGTAAGPARIAEAFARARDEGRAALMPYLSANFPDPETSKACLEAAIQAGADVLEIGIPFSDPMMDGPTIQTANQQVLDAGHTVADHLALCTSLTAETDVPALAMTYATIADARGWEHFADACAAAGLAGVILPDLPPPEADEWRSAAEDADLATVFLASSVSSDQRLDAVAEAANGFVYAAGLLGVTGVKKVAQDDTQVLVERLRERTDLPLAVGIGIRDADDARAVAAYADGVIVGSAVVNAVMAGEAASAPERVFELVTDLRRGCERG